MKTKFIRAILLSLIITKTFAGGNNTNIYQPWIEYANRMKTCQTDQFILPEPNYSGLTAAEKEGLRISSNLQIYKIHGSENGKCIVSNKDQPAPGTINIETQYCDFSKEDIQTIVSFAEDVAKNGQSNTYVREYVNVLKKSCTLVY